MSKDNSYRYFDTPDGEDVVEKLWCVLKPASVVVLAMGTCDVMLYSKPKGYLATIGRYAYLSIPILGMSTAFVITSNLMCSLRKKDDPWNWAAGGGVAATILGAWSGNPRIGSCCAMFFGAAAAGKKYAHQNGVILMPELMVPRMHGGVKAVRHDYSLLEDKVGEWKKKYQ